MLSTTGDIDIVPLDLREAYQMERDIGAENFQSPLQLQLMHSEQRGRYFAYLESLKELGSLHSEFFGN